MLGTNNLPPSSRMARVGLYMLQLALGAVVGGALALIGGWLGPLVTDEASNGWSDLVGSVIGVLAGYALGAPLGVLAAAALLRQRGRALLCLLGGVLSAVAVLLLAEPLRLSQQSSVLVLVYAIVVLQAALLGFHIRRRPAA